jgi:hypothetical protein
MTVGGALLAEDRDQLDTSAFAHFVSVGSEVRLFEEGSPESNKFE